MGKHDSRMHVCQQEMPQEVTITDTSLHQVAQIHSFILAIPIAPLQVHFYSEALPTQHGYCVGVSGHRQLRVKVLPKVPVWRLERDSNPQPFGRKAPNLPMSHHAQIN